MYPKDYIQFLVHFHSDRDYFECHEVLEEYWKTIQPIDRESVWVSLIQVAVGFYHYRRGNIRGAERTFQKTIKRLYSQKPELKKLGLSSTLPYDLEQIVKNVTSGEPYTSYNIPIIDAELIKLCKETSTQQGLYWGSISNLNDVQLIHRHKLRDRTSVIEDRLLELRRRRGQ